MTTRKWLDRLVVSLAALGLSIGLAEIALRLFWPTPYLEPVAHASDVA